MDGVVALAGVKLILTVSPGTIGRMMSLIDRHILETLKVAGMN
jgi:hypothetical protein